MTSIETTKIDLADLDFVFRRRPVTQSKRLTDRLSGAFNFKSALVQLLLRDMSWRVISSNKGCSVSM